MYRHILAAVELDEIAKDVLARAKELSRLFGARLSVLHVVEYLPVDPAGDALLTTPVDLSRERATQAESRLREWCQAAGIGADALKVSVGAITPEIVRTAQESAVDLIVLGHAPRRGLAALFSHTEEGVVHRAPCDVLAIRLKT